MSTESEGMQEKPCECGHTMEQVIKPEPRVRVGWYCPKCKKFDKAIGREAKVRGLIDESKR